MDRFAILALHKLALFSLLLLPVALLSGCPDPVDADSDGFSPDDEDPLLVDCNDNDATINPSQADVCDGVDNDCDGAIDEGLDEDGDGYFEISEALCPDGNDCDDTDATVNPAAEEVCDSVDHDCDTDPTNGLTTTPYYPDGDGDGYGAGESEPNCDAVAPEGYADNDEDCADNDALVNPDATEICNAVDDDCDGEIDAEFDADGDGFTTCGADGQVETGDEDCDDLDELVNPDATEVCNGLDDDCDGAVPADEEDGDLDGVILCDGDCDDAEPLSFPGNPEVCDGLDNDCLDGVPSDEEDGDADTYRGCENDCDDADPAVNPAATEACNGVDDDCDGAIPADETDDGHDVGSVRFGDCDDDEPLSFPGNPEVCDGLDNDCDGTVPADEIDGDVDGYLTCGSFVDHGVVGLLGGDDCDDGAVVTFPGAPELCDGIDNNCDGSVGDELTDGDGDGVSACDGDCDDTNPATNPTATEICDGEDNDCDSALPADETDDVDVDGSVACMDCDDADPLRSPDFEEACDGLDNDCDGSVPADEVDGDADFYLPCTDFVDNGVGLSGGDDCEDGDPALNPGATEVCDADDENCDGVTDEGFDVDEDGVTTCGPDGIDATIDDDCNDSDPTVNPSADEICDLIDNDCDSDIDDNDVNYLGDDLDGDGYGSDLCGGFDCDDNDPTLHPRDDDGDGFTPCTGDCDETDPYVHATAGEACDGVDTDCDGGIDEADPEGVEPDWDGDGYDTDGCGIGGVDCDDRDKHVFPEDLYTSGVEPQCLPVIYPGFTYADQNPASPQAAPWNAGRISLPDYFVDPVSGNHFIYFRGHHDSEHQAVGYVESSDGGVSWGDAVGPILESAPGEWDHRNISQPTVAYLAADRPVADGGGPFARPYVMAYHGQPQVGGSREIGIASSTSPTGPWERVDPGDGVTPISGPTLPKASAGLDNDIVLHPHLYFDPVSELLHMWYAGRATSDPGPKPLRTFHATSDDGGMTWTRTDDDTNGESDVVLEASDSPWLTGMGANQVSQVNVIEDPTGSTDFEIWYTGGLAGAGFGVGAGTGTATSWDSPSSLPALESATDCRRFDGEVITGRGIRYDVGADAYHWYYGGQTNLNPVDCAGNEDVVFENGGNTASYVAYGINTAPLPEIDPITAPATTLTITGSVTDTAPDQVIVTLESDVDGFLGTATVTPVAVPGPGVLTTSWALINASLSSGPHTIAVTAVDEAQTVRRAAVAVTIP